MDRAELRQSLKQLLEDNVGRTFDHVNEDDDLRGSLGLDSVDLVTMLFEIQSRWGVNIPGEQLEKLSKVGEVLDVIEAHLASGGKAAA
jgi:acyl carrier protein